MSKRLTFIRWACTTGAVVALLAWSGSYCRARLENGHLKASRTTRGMADFNGPMFIQPTWDFAGLQWTWGKWGAWRISIPLWHVAILLSVPAALLWARHLRSRNVTNPCPTCNYSLTGLPAGSACPECGKAAHV